MIKFSTVFLIIFVINIITIIAAIYRTVKYGKGRRFFILAPFIMVILGVVVYPLIKGFLMGAGVIPYIKGGDDILYVMMAFFIISAVTSVLIIKIFSARRLSLKNDIK